MEKIAKKNLEIGLHIGDISIDNTYIHGVSGLSKCGDLTYLLLIFLFVFNYLESSHTATHDSVPLGRKNRDKTHIL